ncbi:MAG: asparagine synthase (glutamine-hydrolyzing) [Minwuia sp.]|uniref:asparagine synthase (glutamine-hydrolyzing) n=1 Tax=Minwuia sp. TaxID=2493630 RepID=UPI003A848959
MCGIAGHIGAAPPTPDRIDAALEALRRRGPDASGTHQAREGANAVTLLHTRLAIIDLDRRSNQPFRRDGLSLVFNGEIYNHVEVRRLLERRGISFTTRSDTEVLLEAYRVWGEDCVDYLEGMWAFAIHDADRHRVFISRDPFGEKPLLWRAGGNGVWFASEIAALSALTGRRPAVNTDTVRRYLVNGYKALYKSEALFHEDVRELPPGCNLVIGGNGDVTIRRYWRPEYRPDSSMSFGEAVDGIWHHLSESMRLRLRADVPIAFCLSGGVDSAALASFAAKQHGAHVTAFSIIDPDPRYDESDNIHATVKDLGCVHHEIHLQQSSDLDRFAALIRYHGKPVATASYYVHAMLSEAMRERGFKVAVSGTGADELVSGYYDHFNLHLHAMKGHPDRAQRIDDWRTHLGPIVRNPHLRDPLLYDRDPAFRGHIYLNADVFSDYLTEPFAEPFTEEPLSDDLMRNRMLNELCHEAVPIILREDDLNSMKNSIENRSPYLDRALCDFAYSIPPEHLIRDGYAKAPLRAAAKGILNDKVRLDRHKKGFNAAFRSLFDLDNPKTRERILDDGPIFDLVRREKIEQAMSMPELPNSFSKFLFSFVSAKLFMEQSA